MKTQTCEADVFFTNYFSRLGLKISLAAGLFVLVGHYASQAAVSTFTDLTSFQNGMTTALNDFNGTIPAYNNGYTFSATAGSIQYDYTITSSFGQPSFPSMAAFNSVGFSTFLNTATLTITFGVNGTALPTAVGGNIFAITSGSPAPTVSGTVNATVAGGSLNVSSTAGATGSAVGFAGFTTDSSGFSSITFSGVGLSSGNLPALDNLYVGQAVPEPGGLVAVGFISLLVFSRTGWAIRIGSLPPVNFARALAAPRDWAADGSGDNTVVAS